MPKPKPPQADDKPKLLLVPLSAEDHELVADFAAAHALPTIEAGAPASAASSRKAPHSVRGTRLPAEDNPIAKLYSHAHPHKRVSAAPA